MASLYADHPFPLIPTPAHKEAEPDMFSRVASEMSLVHNMVIRGLNSIYLQAPRVSQNDVPSFLQYALAWWALVNVHHTGEETDFFPYLEDATGQKGLMDVNVDQHHAFRDGLQSFKTYMEDCVAGKQTFEGNKVVGIIDEFGKVLVTHLTDEIPTLLQLREVGMDKLGGLEKQFGLEGEKNMKLLGLVQGLPFCFCNHDVQYEDGKWASWPPAPRIVHILARHVTYWVHRDRWKFAACDRYGQLRPLHCLSQEKA
ncbi:hemerythrin HHE cation binding domain-containing protein [Ilyonectria sp. MPI-CAGE-AT-0026]|nr:hemerythrin HHE cation binding domain-containing protein [Ilyonectria sp. MPI-CAGE-AT-0026]